MQNSVARAQNVRLFISLKNQNVTEDRIPSLTICRLMVLQYLSSKYFSLLHRNVQGGFFMRFSIRRLVWNFFFRMAVGLVLIVAVNFVCTLANIPLWVGINPVTAAATGFFGVPGVLLLYGVVGYGL